MSSEIWNKLAEERERLQPTPKVSDPVIYYTRGDKNFPVPALCSAVEGPGRIKVTLFPHGAMLQHRAGCHHVSHWVHDKPNETTRNNGSWDFAREIPKDAYDLHEAELSKKENMLLESEEKAKEAARIHAEKAAEREKMIAEKLAGTSKPAKAKKQTVPKTIDI